MNNRRLAVVAAVAAATITALLPATALASTGTARQTAPVGAPSFNAKDATCENVTSSAGSTRRCTQIERLPLKDLTPAQRAERQRAMNQIAAKAKARAAISAQPTVTAPAQCDFSSTDFTLSGVSNPSRFVSCSDVLWTASVWIIEDGIPEPEGFFYFEDQSWNLYSVSSLSWTHGMDTIGYTEGAFGVLAEGLDTILNSNCDDEPGICSATSLTGPDVQPVDILPGVTNSFEWDESDTGPASTTAKSVDDLTDFLGVDWLVITYDLGEATETGYLAGRCDNKVGKSSGCVDQGFTPPLILSLEKYGAAADMILWAQTFLTGDWGVQADDNPLTRLVNKTQRRANRAGICRDGTFVKISTIGANDGDKDSCDEFPFAATHQSVGSTTKGAACAQVEAVSSGTTTGSPTGSTVAQEAADWPTVSVIGTYSADAPCVRGHIPLKLNKAVGGAYSGFIKANRLIASDPFWVSVTA